MNLQKYKNCLESIDLDSIQKLKKTINLFNKIIILGNGGSNAISSHIAEDYTKVLGKKALCFGDSARMSCYANDYGWENAYCKFVEHFADKDTLIILISSSGNSQNILNVAEYCVQRHSMITMSGFDIDNKLKTNYNKHSLLHFWIDSNDYGIVECLHELILHSIL
jgi:D-sedoheptulose 7-phosphate isomerase